MNFETSPRVALWFFATTKSKFHLQIPRLPYQHNTTKKIDMMNTNRAKERVLPGLEPGTSRN